MLEQLEQLPRLACEDRGFRLLRDCCAAVKHAFRLRGSETLQRPGQTTKLVVAPLNGVPSEFVRRTASGRAAVDTPLRKRTMEVSCQRCGLQPAARSSTRACSHGCTFCEACADALGGRCPNCGGALDRVTEPA